MLACRSVPKRAPCVVYGDVIFWNSTDNHCCTCERFIGKMLKRLLEGKVGDRKNASDMATID